MSGIIFATPKIGDFPMDRMDLRTIFDEAFVSRFGFSHFARRIWSFGREASGN